MLEIGLIHVCLFLLCRQGIKKAALSEPPFSRDVRASGCCRQIAVRFGVIVRGASFSDVIRIGGFGLHEVYGAIVFHGIWPSSADRTRLFVSVVYLVILTCKGLIGGPERDFRRRLAPYGMGPHCRFVAERCSKCPVSRSRPGSLGASRLHGR